MLSCYLLTPDEELIGALGSDFTYTTTKNVLIGKVSFYKTVDGIARHLFITEFNQPRTLNKGDTVRVNLDSGIDFYYLITKAKFLLDEGFEEFIVICRGIYKIAEKIKHERQARDEFNSWDPQIYHVLFNEKQ